MMSATVNQLALLVVFTTSLATCVLASEIPEPRCEEISVPMCRGIGYNYTSMPNIFHHDTQDEAGLEVHQFYPLVEIQCSEDLRFFLCSMYTPICIEDYPNNLPACRSVCERAKHGCAPIMSQYGFQWPERMNCSELPVYGDGRSLCMDAKEGARPSLEQPDIKPEEEEKFRIQSKNMERIKGKSFGRGKTHHHSSPAPIPTLAEDVEHKVELVPPGGCHCDCPSPHFIHLSGPESSGTLEPFAYHQHQALHHFNYSRIETAGGLAPLCAVSCQGTFRFGEAERETALFWIGIVALVCSITCFLTVLTYLTDSQRFRYPERAIIFLAGCYMFIAGGYLLRMRLGHAAIACDGPYIRYQRTGPTPASCVLSFILIYFFGMSSAYWWLILTLTWFLAAGLKWSSEAITGYAQYFHLLAWLLPTAQSVAILCLGAIDGDPFVGVCSVGNQSRANLLIFVITPLCVCIAIGSFFLIAGFVALFRIRRAIRQRPQTIRVKTDKLEKLMMRIGLSSFLYIVPEVVVVACHIYEYIYRPQWEKLLACRCGSDMAINHSQPQFALIVLKYIMSLLIGITSGFWIWSGKTLESWLRIYSKIICCSSPFGSPANSRSGTTQLLPNMAYRGVALNVNSGSLQVKAQSVNLVPLNGPPPSQHHLHGPGHLHYSHLHHERALMPPSLPPPLPPPPPPLMISNHHGGSLTGSQFTHMIGSGSNANGKAPLSHV